MLRAIVRVLIDSQAWLYANQLKLQAKLSDPTAIVSEADFERWQAEWKQETAALIKEQEDHEQE